MKKFNNLSANLEILAEEAAEVIQAKSKIVRFGLNDFHPKNMLPNKEKLEEEIGHFIAIVNILIENGTISQDGINRGKSRKKDKMNRWYLGEETLCNH